MTSLNRLTPLHVLTSLNALTSPIRVLLLRVVELVTTAQIGYAQSAILVLNSVLQQSQTVLISLILFRALSSLISLILLTHK